MTFIINPKSIAEARALGLPKDALLRWNMCIQDERPLGWRALSMWMQAETTMAYVDGNPYLAADTQLLSDIAHKHYLSLMPRGLEIAA